MVRSQTNETGETGVETVSAADAWAKAAAGRKYGVHNGVPYGGAEGFVVSLKCPGDWFALVPVEQQGTEFQSRAEYMLNRVAQPEAKKDGATHETVQAAVDKAMMNGFEPSRARDKDPVEAEVERRFETAARKEITSQAPDATDAQIGDTVLAWAQTDRGREIMNGYREEILASRTYAVQRKARKGSAPALAVSVTTFGG